MKYLIFFVFAIATFNTSAQCTGYAMTITFNNPTCFGFCDGSLTVNTIGGNGGETFTITDSTGTQINVGNGNSGNSLCAGWYYVNVVDMMACTLSDSVELIEPLQMTIDSTITDALCSYDSTGSIVIDSLHNPTGNPNFVGYFWSPNPNSVGTSSDSTGQIPAGIYSLQVNDENGCSEQFDFTVNSPPPLVFSNLGFEPCTGGSNGVVYMSAAGGTPDYDYVWTRLSDSASTSNTTWGGQAPGCYEAWITDNNGCELKDTLCIGCLGQAEINFDFDVYPNPASNHLVLNYATSNQIDIEIWSMDGRRIIRKQNVSSNQLIELDNISSGTYVLIASGDGLLGQKIIVIE